MTWGFCLSLSEGMGERRNMVWKLGVVLAQHLIVTLTLSPVLARISCNLTCPCCRLPFFPHPHTHPHHHFLFLLASSVSGPSVYLFVSVCFPARISQFPFPCHVSFILFVASISAAGEIDFYFALVFVFGFCFALLFAERISRCDLTEMQTETGIETQSSDSGAWLKSPPKDAGNLHS